MRQFIGTLLSCAIGVLLWTAVADAAQRAARPVRPGPYYELPSPGDEGIVTQDENQEGWVDATAPWTPWTEEGWFRPDSPGPFAPAAPPGESGLYFGADYLLIRPHFSEATAFVRETTVNNTNQSVLTDEAVNYPLDYQGSYRAFVGYRPCGCDSQIQVTYWRFVGDSTVAAAVGANENVVLFDFLENIADQPGDHVTATNHLTASVLDLDFSKRLMLGGQSGDPCSFPCPLWDLTWSAGVRFADIDRQINLAMFDAQNALHRTSAAAAQFTGVGPRLGVAGRRYYGPCQRFALLASGHASLLVGDYDLSMVRVMVATPEARSVQTTSVSRVIPVLEMELGGAYRFSQRITISAGYLVQAWFDLGMTEAIGGTVAAVDDSNILGFDGLFFRGQFDF